MIRRPPRSTLFPLHDALPISAAVPRRARITFTELLIGAAATRGGHVTDAILAAGLSRSWPRITGCLDRKSTRLNSSHANISYAVFCLKKKKHKINLIVVEQMK